LQINFLCEILVVEKNLMSQVPIERQLAVETVSKKYSPIMVSQQCADNLTIYQSDQCRQHSLVQALNAQYAPVANVANLQTLENRLREARDCKSYLDGRAEFNQLMAEQLSMNRGSTSDVVDRYGKRSVLMAGMPGVYHAYQQGCQKYDAASKAAQEGASSAQVAGLVEKGLASADKSISGVQSTLASAKEDPMPSK